MGGRRRPAQTMLKSLPVDGGGRVCAVAANGRVGTERKGRLPPLEVLSLDALQLSARCLGRPHGGELGNDVVVSGVPDLLELTGLRVRQVLEVEGLRDVVSVDGSYTTGQLVGKTMLAWLGPRTVALRPFPRLLWNLRDRFFLWEFGADVIELVCQVRRSQGRQFITAFRSLEQPRALGLQAPAEAIRSVGLVVAALGSVHRRSCPVAVRRSVHRISFPRGIDLEGAGGGVAPGPQLDRRRSRVVFGQGPLMVGRLPQRGHGRPLVRGDGPVMVRFLPGGRVDVGGSIRTLPVVHGRRRWREEGERSGSDDLHQTPRCLHVPGKWTVGEGLGGETRGKNNEESSTQKEILGMLKTGRGGEARANGYLGRACMVQGGGWRAQSGEWRGALLWVFSPRVRPEQPHTRMPVSLAR